MAIAEGRATGEMAANSAFVPEVSWQALNIDPHRLWQPEAAAMSLRLFEKSVRLVSASIEPMKSLTFFLLFDSLVPSSASAQRITVKGNQFQVYGKEIWISGANTPWQTWNEFGNKFDAAWWGAHFHDLNGVPASTALASGLAAMATMRLPASTPTARCRVRLRPFGAISTACSRWHKSIAST